jgi:hypothetical protein
MALHSHSGLNLALAILAVVCTTADTARAGAWTQNAGEGQVIVSSILSNARRSYDASSRPTEDVTFHKSFESAFVEYGWKDWLTLVAVPEYADAISAAPGRPTQKARDFAFSGGARIRLWTDASVFSLQALARSAGAFELDTSFRQKPGRDFELRALYGTHFQLLGHEGCVDVELAQRWATDGRPDEIPLDISLIYDIGWKTQAFAQSFNTISEGAGRSPFVHYRYHKLAVSLVRPVWGKTSLQIGGFVSPAGQNALKEQGIFLSVWTRF